MLVLDLGPAGASLSPLEGFCYLREAPAIHVDAFPVSPRAASPCGLYPSLSADPVGHRAERSLVAA